MASIVIAFDKAEISRDVQDMLTRPSFYFPGSVVVLVKRRTMTGTTIVGIKTSDGKVHSKNKFHFPMDAVEVLTDA